MNDETILQFGAGRFLRGFLDRFVHQANEAGQRVGRIAIVQSTPGERAAAINRHAAGFPVVVRGIENGAVVDRVEQVGSVSRAIVAAEAWNDVLALARSPALRMIVSNATEAGYVLDDGDRPQDAPPKTLPAKLTAVLHARFMAGAPAVTLLPCELIQHNADKLRELVQTQARRWSLDDRFLRWLTDECRWLNNLVDCMITDMQADDPHLAANPLAVQAEPYALLAIQASGGDSAKLFEHPAIRIVEDLEPYFLRKVRMLNGVHSAMVGKFFNRGFATVQAVLADRAAERWVRDLLFEEIVPTIAYRIAGVAEFADTTLERFRNPFLAHRLADISLNHEQKVAVRLRPTADEYQRLFGRPAKRLNEAIERDIRQP